MQSLQYVAIFTKQILKFCEQISGFMAVVLAGIWTGHHLGGFAWQSDPKHQFNWHPLLMTLGMIYLYGNGKYQSDFQSQGLRFPLNDREFNPF